MMQSPWLHYNPAHLTSYLTMFVWTSFYIAILVLAIVFYNRTKRKPFLLVFVAFLLYAVRDVYVVIIDANYLVINLIDMFGMSTTQAMLTSILAYTLPHFVLSAFAVVLLFVAIIQFYKESKWV